jgi:hypothetical protein
MTLKEECAFHWQRLGISDPKILREHIVGIFGRHNHQQEILIDLYRLALPQWDEITKVTGYPEVGKELWIFICRLFQEFDRKHHPGCLPGGAWMNVGFSVNEKLEPWEIAFDNCHVQYHKESLTLARGREVKSPCPYSRGQA